MVQSSSSPAWLDVNRTEVSGSLVSVCCSVVLIIKIVRSGRRNEILPQLCLQIAVANTVAQSIDIVWAANEELFARVVICDAIEVVWKFFLLWTIVAKLVLALAMLLLSCHNVKALVMLARALVAVPLVALLLDLPQFVYGAVIIDSECDGSKGGDFAFVVVLWWSLISICAMSVAAATCFSAPSGVVRRITLKLIFLISVFIFDWCIIGIAYFLHMFGGGALEEELYTYGHLVLCFRGVLELAAYLGMLRLERRQSSRFRVGSLDVVFRNRPSERDISCSSSNDLEQSPSSFEVELDSGQISRCQWMIHQFCASAPPAAAQELEFSSSNNV